MLRWQKVQAMISDRPPFLTGWLACNAPYALLILQVSGANVADEGSKQFVKLLLLATAWRRAVCAAFFDILHDALSRINCDKKLFPGHRRVGSPGSVPDPWLSQMSVELNRLQHTSLSVCSVCYKQTNGMHCTKLISGNTVHVEDQTFHRQSVTGKVRQWSCSSLQDQARNKDDRCYWCSGLAKQLLSSVYDNNNNNLELIHSPKTSWCRDAQLLEMSNCQLTGQYWQLRNSRPNRPETQTQTYMGSSHLMDGNHQCHTAEIRALIFGYLKNRIPDEY